MRKIVAAALVCLFLATPAFAQQSSADAERKQKRFTGKMKIIGGSALVAVGLLKVMNSSTVGEIPDGSGRMQEERFTSGLGVAMGLGAAGAGGWLIWSGMKDRAAARSPQVGIVVGKRKAAVAFSKSW